MAVSIWAKQQHMKRFRCFKHFTFQGCQNAFHGDVGVMSNDKAIQISMMEEIFA